MIPPADSPTTHAVQETWNNLGRWSVCLRRNTQECSLGQSMNKARLLEDRLVLLNIG